MKRQWRKFLRQAKKQGLYRSEYSPCVVPWLLRYLQKSIKARCAADIEDITATLRDKHSIGLDLNGNLYFLPLDEVSDEDGIAGGGTGDRMMCSAVDVPPLNTRL